ncbi:hypothetical protein [Bdellovibrio sp. BCCA]|uniref:hypothetical protein n=1 Tax=Bdellovibrio sp. BCCA TaxID=3136281 RepID=UPI0030F10166
MSLAYIRNYYQVPAKRGATVKFQGKEYRITSAKGAYLRVNDGAKKITIHPTWRVEYS